MQHHLDQAGRSVPASRRRRRQSRWELLIERLHLDGPAGRAVAIVAAVVAVLALGAVFRWVQAKRQLDRAHVHLVAARTALAGKRVDAANAALKSGESDVRAARHDATAFPASLFNVVPLVGSPGRALRDTSDAALHVVAAGRLMSNAVGDFPTSSGKTGINGHNLGAIHDAAVNSTVAMAASRIELEKARAAMDGPRSAMLPFVSGAAKPVSKLLSDAVGQLDAADRGIVLLSDLTASTTDARILLLSQDTLELRATGGFIGSVGVIHFSHGTVALEDYHNYEDLPPATPPLKPPAELANWLPGQWEVSNTNWWPNFPTSAATAKDMYFRQTGVAVDGVVAITERVMARLIGVFGPLQVPGYTQPVTENGFEDRVVYEVELKRPPDTPRKKFLQLLSQQVFDRLFSLPSNQLPDVAKVFAAAATQGDIQSWFPDAGREAAVAGTSWAGTVPATGKDFLMLVDADRRAGKANKDVSKDVNYRVTVDSDGYLTAHLEVKVRNAGQVSVVNPYYDGFLRVYVPRGSVLLNPSTAQVLGRAATANDDDGELPLNVRSDGPALDAPYDVFSADVTVNPLSTRKVEFDYVLPYRVAPGGNYHLTWVRQAGTPNDTMTALIDGHATSMTSDGRVLSVQRRVGAAGIRGWLHRHTPLRHVGV